MKNSNSRRQQTRASQGSSSLVLNPYFLEDTALTACELNRVRSHQIRFVESR